MQNVFPYLLSQILYVPLILRLTAGTYFLVFGYRGLTLKWQDRFDFFKENQIKPSKFFATATATLNVLGGAFLMMGFLTQITALVLMIVCLTALVVKMKNKDAVFPEWNKHVYIFLSIILFCLFIAGAGFNAMDIPL